MFAFGNNEKTNAPGYFTHTSPPGDYLQSGFTLGGPLRRNKLFFFGDYQHISDNAGRTTRSIIPPAAYRNGDFSASPTLIYDPLTGNADGTGRTPFPNNVIPANRISPIAKAILANLPAPNIAGAAPGQPNYQVDYARVKTTDSFDTKFNWQMSQTDQISARLSFLRPKLDDPAEFGAFGGSKQGSPSGNGFSGIGTDTTYSTGVNYTRTWSSTLVMEARGGMNYFHNEALSGGHGLKTAEEVGIRGANIDEWTSGMTQIDFGTNLSLSNPLVGFSGSLPWDRSERTVQFATVFTKVAGNHTIKFGEDFRHTRDFLLQTQDNGGPRGQFQFRAPQTSIPSDAAATARLRERVRLVPARRALARSARPEGDGPGRPVLGVLLVHPGQVGGDAEADDRPRPAARVLHAVRRPGGSRAGCRTTIRRRTRCRSPATATSARASACRST